MHIMEMQVSLLQMANLLFFDRICKISRNTNVPCRLYGYSRILLYLLRLIATNRFALAIPLLTQMSFRDSRPSLRLLV